MAEAPLQFEIVSPEAEPIALSAEQVTMPGSGGILTVLPEHTPLLTTLAHGVVVAHIPESEPRFFAVHEGFAEVAEDRVTVLAERMEPSEIIDTMRAQAALERARDRLEKRDSRTNIARAEAALARAMARLKARSGEEY